MIDVENLTKYYGRSLAIENVSFSLDEGKILGLLGPNGAGKSTTMNIITGYISADRGTVRIDGIDMFEKPLEAKKKIGYMPEVPPLYNDMTVEKYLAFMFNLKKVRLPMKAHLDKICQDTQIEDVRGKIIKYLSKGYKQRVGLAQALIGDPPVLILDEPTAGLDPAQIIEMRKLVRELGKNHTVIMSSHVLSEVQAVCDKIIVINKGTVAADAFTSELTGTGSGTSKLRLIVEGREKSVLALLKRISGVTDVSGRGETERGCYEFIVESNTDVRRPVYRALAKADYNILNMSPVALSLEETYLDIISGKYSEKEADDDDGDIQA